MPTRSRPIDPDPGPSTSTSTSRKRKSSYSPTYELPPLIAPSVRDADAQPDPDFLALSRKQRRAIDEAFAVGLRAVIEREEEGNRAGKRRRMEEGGAGGFDTESRAGGFDVDQDAIGGFVADNVDMDTSGGGGFFGGEDVTLTSTTPHTSITQRRTHHLLPLSSLPTVMSSLGLSVDDDVLAVFESTGFQNPDSEMAGVHQEHCRIGIEGGGDDWDGQGGIAGYTSLRDFRAVCAAMLEPEPESEGEGGQEDGMEVDEANEDQGDDSQEEVYEEEEDDSPLSELDSDDGRAGYDPSSGLKSTTKTKSGNKPAKLKKKGKTSPADDTDLLLPSTAQPKSRLTPDQKANVTRLWELMFQGTPASTLANQTGKYGGSRGERFLGRDQVKRWAEIMGENWNDQEITDMIELFSTQPGRRGLSYDDFSTVLIRGGLL